MTNDKKFLIFNVATKDRAGVLVDSITEVFQVSLADILPVPDVPGCVLGIYNWRGEMLWLVDLEYMLGYPPLTPAASSLPTLMAIVLQTPGKSLGLVVRQLIDIEWLDIEQMKAVNPELFSRQILTFLQGYFINDSNEIIMSLDDKAIIQASIWERRN